MAFSKHFTQLSRQHRISLSIFLLTLLAGCAVKDFLSQRYENSVAYFNTYYNASRLFDEAILEIETTEKAQRSRGLPPSKEISATARQKLTTVIEKCSKLLQYYPTSKWVDDALMLIGESYYYMGEYPKAERKFAELIAQFPTSDRFLEARLWLGKSFKRGNDSEKAIRELNEVAQAAIAESENRIAEEALLALGELYVEQKSYKEAVKSYQDLLDHSDSDGRKAEAQFRIGEMHENTQDYEKAAEAYRKVLDFKSDNSVRYAARFRHAINANRTKRYEEALRGFYELLDDRSNVEFFPQIKLEIAKVLHDKGEIENAMEAYRIIDTSYARTDGSAKAFYQLGLIYEKDLLKYAAAETNYVRARVEFPSSEIVPLANQRASSLQRYISVQRMIWNTDSLLAREEEMLSMEQGRSGKHSPDSLLDSLSNRNVDSLKALKEAEKSNPASGTLTSLAKDSLKSLSPDSLATRKTDTLRTRLEQAKSAERNRVIRNLNTTLAQQTYELAVLFFLDLEKADSAMFWCEKAASISPDSQLASRALYTLAEIHRSYNPEDRAVVDSIYRKILADYPKSTYAAEVKRVVGLEVKKEETDPATAVYREGEEYLQRNDPAKAIEVLQKLVRDFPTSSYSPKSQYAIGWIYENVEGRPDSAAANYARLTKLFPSSTYAAVVRTKLAEAERLALEEKMKQDSTTLRLGEKPNITPVDSLAGQKVITPLDSIAAHQQPLRPGEKLKRRFREEDAQEGKKTEIDTSRIIKE